MTPQRRAPRFSTLTSGVAFAALGLLGHVGVVSPSPGSDPDSRAAGALLERAADPSPADAAGEGDASPAAPIDSLLPCRAAILVEGDTGAVLYAQNADATLPPASLAKMALQIVVFRELVKGHATLSDSVVASANAATMGGSQVFLEEGEKQTLESLLEAVVIVSANDAAVAIAEHFSGSEAEFAARMNETAEELGCTHTHFVNVHGLDLARQGQNGTSARDMACLARALLDYPYALTLASTRRAPFRGGEFWLESTNEMLGRYEGLDGLKTGFTTRSGGCFCATASRGGRRLVSVVMGAGPGRERFHITRKLLDAGFAEEGRAPIDLARAKASLAGSRGAARTVSAPDSGSGSWYPVPSRGSASSDLRE
jgi:D-alanyl-D-alanine carboxypeptidase (penicillin-binding protein 5/6)